MDFLTKELIYQKSPQQLTALLYEVCIVYLNKGIDHIKENEFAAANHDLQKVNDIIERLGVGINYEAGIIADQLDTLYNYMANQVIAGNLKKDVTILEEVLKICEDLASAWNEAMQTGETEGMRQLQQKTNEYEKNVTILSRD